MRKNPAVILLLVVSLASPAWGAPVVFFDTIPDGRASFDAQVAAVGGTQTNDVLSELVTNTNSWSRTGYAITSTNAANRATGDYLLNPAGDVEGGQSINMTADGSTTSGLTFTFDVPINAFAIDLGDWATCCHPSTMYISFDGGDPIAVGTADEEADNPGFAEFGE